MEVEGVVTPVARFSSVQKQKVGKDRTRFSHSPSHGALLAGGGGLVCLTLDAQVHDVVPEDSIHKPRRDSPEKHLKNISIPADRTVVHNNVPGPKSHCVPFFHLLKYHLHDF